jgi:predicted ribosomally synthesized peptide with nif11-like leader
MSRENVVFFSKAINSDPALNRLVSDAEPTVEAWVRIARSAGFEISAEEFASVIGETLGRKVTPVNAVREYLCAQYLTGTSELSE